MIRTQLYLTESEKAGIEAIAYSQGISQSDLIRQAIDDLLMRKGKMDKKRILKDVAGIWEKKKKLPNVRKLRSGWNKRVS